MVNFVLVESEYPKVPELLLSHVQGFADSFEYARLNEVERRLPGVVAAAFTQFFVRLQDAEISGEPLVQEANSLSQAYEAIEQLSQSSDTQVRTLVEDEVFENVRATDATWRTIASRLGRESKRLFDAWRRSNAR